MNNADRQYLELLKYVLDVGDERLDRTGVGTVSTFGGQMRFDLNEGFPLLTTKKVFWKGVVEELLWFLRGETNVKSLQESGVHIWDAWADKDGNLGRIYGAQWRNWNGWGIDQISGAIQLIKTDPSSRRIIVSAWNPEQLDDMALPPCHAFFQFYVSNGKLSCHLYQRSADIFLGVPFNIASYALLTHMVAQVCGLGVGSFIHSFGDLHIYKNHIAQVKEQLQREPYELPTLVLDSSIKNIDDFRSEHIRIENYKSHPTIKAEIAV